MRISRKIGLSFFITFLLVIVLGVLSIYSLKHTYRGLSQVFARDLPASRTTYQIAISMERLFSELNNFLITGNENFKISYEKAHEEIARDISALARFISEEEETGLFEETESLIAEIDGTARDIFKNRKDMEALYKDLRAIETEFTKKLDSLFDFEENKMRDEKDFLLVRTQYLPASDLIAEARLRFSKAFSDLNEVDFLILEKSLRDYKNYYGYSLSDKERSLATELIEFSGKIKLIGGSIVDLKAKTGSYVDLFLAKGKDFTETLDKIISLKKSGISSKLGAGAALTEDIPAIHNISKIEKDMAESWRTSSRYILTGDETYMARYRQLRLNIEKALKDYGRHARLRGTEKFFDDILESDSAILKRIDSGVTLFNKKQSSLSELLSIGSEIENKINGLLAQKDSLIKEAKDPQDILEELMPARWMLMRLKDEFASASRLIMDYLSEQELKYKDQYSESYFDMKKYMNRYRNLAGGLVDSVFVKEIGLQLDSFNSAVLGVIDSHDSLMKERGWTLIELQSDLKSRLGKAVEAEISQIEKNKKDLANRMRTINIVIFIIIGVVAFIAVFVIFYTMSSITNPIQALYNGAGIIGKGNLDHRLDIKTGDEIQDLAEGFNNMAGELKELYTNLENKVKERTAQLAEANDALALKNKELDDFTYIVSHDLKEPLRGVKAFTKLLKEEYSEKINKEGKEYLETISESSSRMTGLIEDLLNLSRIGRIKNIEPDIDFNELLSDVKKNLQYSLEEKKVELKIPENLPKVACDKIRISEVFSNLISNAVKYCKKGVKPVVEVGFSSKVGHYEFYVKDNGIGIDKAYHDRVFQIFQRLHAKGEYEGTGAGLTIVKKIVENHGGKIWVESESGKGSTFYFTIAKKTKKQSLIL
ncbi:ATP-binding protein [Candidatus Omnitrophota bacterium]